MKSLDNINIGTLEKMIVNHIKHIKELYPNE